MPLLSVAIVKVQHIRSSMVTDRTGGAATYIASNRDNIPGYKYDREFQAAFTFSGLLMFNDGVSQSMQVA